MDSFFESLANLINSGIDSITNVFQFVTDGFSTIIQYAGILPTLWGLYPAPFTALLVSMLAISLFATLLMSLLRH